MGDGIETQHRQDDLQARLEQIERDVHRLLAAIDGPAPPGPTPPTLARPAAAPPAADAQPSPFLTGAYGANAVSPSRAPLGTPSGFTAGRARFVRNLIRRRRERERHFAADLFADPAWDMMLDLYAAHYERRPVSVSSLCIAAAVPATTALRWIKTLVDEGLFVRIADPDDGRRIHVHLADDTRRRLDDYFDDFED